MLIFCKEILYLRDFRDLGVSALKDLVFCITVSSCLLHGQVDLGYKNFSGCCHLAETHLFPPPLHSTCLITTLPPLSSTLSPFVPPDKIPLEDILLNP